MAIPRSIEHFLGDQHVSYAVLAHRPAFTAQEEAAVTHVPGGQWAKTVVCVADDRPILAVLPASAKIDVNRLRLATGARTVRLANEREFESLYPECETGAVPPLGPLYGQKVFIDRSLADRGEIVFHAGSHTDAIRVKYADFLRAVKPHEADFAMTPGTRTH